jgi:hypothetical protein
VPDLAWAAVKGLAGTGRELGRLFRDLEWQEVDMSWLELPPGHVKLTVHRHSNDLLRRWFHPRVKEIELLVDVDPAAHETVERCRFLPSANRDGWFEVPVWLRLESQPSRAEIMVGETRLGWTLVPDDSWNKLQQQANNHVFADGSLFFDVHDDARPPELKVSVPA